MSNKPYILLPLYEKNVLWTLEHFTTLEINEIYSRLIKCSAFLKLQPWVRGGQGYSKTNDGAFDLITHGGSFHKPIPNLINRPQWGGGIVFRSILGQSFETVFRDSQA